MILNLSDVYSEDLSYLKDNISNPHHKNLLLQKPGINHYSLLSFFSKKINNSLIVELGTYAGTSALALSSNKKNIVETYDLCGDPFSLIQMPNNLKKNIGNIFDLGHQNKLLNAKLIFIDTAHNGEFEYKVIKYLIDNNYKGIVIVDDIYWNGKMYYFWKAIKIKKADLTLIGHGDGSGPNGNISGTGLIDFSNELKINYNGVEVRFSKVLKIFYIKIKYFFKSFIIKNKFIY
jgi:hypothetical protein